MNDTASAGALRLVLLVSIVAPGALGAQNAPPPPTPPAQDENACALPPKEPMITSVTVLLPLELAKGYNQVVRAFVVSGHPPTSSSPAIIEWILGARTDALGNEKMRRIRATIYSESDSTTRVDLAASEASSYNNGKYGSIKEDKPLSQNNGGTGRRVWCGMMAIADSLRGWYPQ
jgi:hypothetical protein